MQGPVLSGTSLLNIHRDVDSRAGAFRDAPHRANGAITSVRNRAHDELQSGHRKKQRRRQVARRRGAISAEEELGVCDGSVFSPHLGKQRFVGTGQGRYAR